MVEQIRPITIGNRVPIRRGRGMTSIAEQIKCRGQPAHLISSRLVGDSESSFTYFIILLLIIFIYHDLRNRARQHHRAPGDVARRGGLLR